MESFSVSKKEGKGIHILTWIIIFSCLVFRLYILYFPFKLYGYLVPPGQDPINHLGFVQEIFNGKYFPAYPPLFHYLIGLIVKFSHMDTLRVIKWVTPAMVALPSIAVFVFLKKSFGQFAAIVGFLIALLASNYGLMAYVDGNYPNILAGGFFLPIALAYLAVSPKSRKVSNYIIVVVFAILTVLTHHLSAAIFAVILFSYSLVLLIWNKKEQIAPEMKKMAVFSVAIIVLLSVLALLTPIRDTVLALIKQLSINGSLVNNATFIKPIDFWQYPEMVGSLVWSGGLISLFYLVYMLGKKGQANKAAILLILVWFLVLFVLSRMSMTGLPGRFARELGIPLILAMAITIKELFLNFSYKIQRIIGYGLIALIIAFNLVQINQENFTSPNFFNQMIWFDRFDLEKANYIKSVTTPDDVIFANRTTPYLPYFAKRNIDFNIEDKLGILPAYAKKQNAKYLFIGKLTRSNPDTKSYPFFKYFDETTKTLQSIAAEKKLKIVHTFGDGSVLYKF